MATKNKLYTKSYFMKRLREAGIPVSELPIQYNDVDVRKWSLLIYPKYYNIIIDCIFIDRDNFHFKIHPYNIAIDTRSMEVITDRLKQLTESN